MANPADRMPSQLPLHEWACLRSELIWIYDRPVEPEHRQWKGKGAALPGYRAWLMRRGTVSMKTGSRICRAVAGQWIIPVKKAAEASFSKDAHILSIHFLCQWPSGENLLSGGEGLVFSSRDHPALERLAKGLLRHLHQQFPGDPQGYRYGSRASGYGDFLKVQCLFLEWLALWFQIEMENGARLTRLTSGDGRPFQAARCLNLAPLDRGFPAGLLEKECGLGLMRLNQLFFSEFGLTARKYWDQRRLAHARQCLETSRMPMKEIAFRLGFRSDSHFVVWFRRLAGIRPGDYRQNYLASLRY